MEKLRIKKGTIKLIGLIISSLVLFFLLGWLGFSYFSMRSDRPYVGMLIDLEDNTLATKVKSDFPLQDGKILIYMFPIIVEQYSEREEEYVLTGLPLNYRDYYETRDEARFEYTLSKDLGKYDFAQIEWNDSLLISLHYRIDKDFKYFVEFSKCTLKRAYSELFNIDNPCRRGNCIIKRELTSWSIESDKKDSAEKLVFLQSYDYNSLIRSMTNFYITDEYGYFDYDNLKLQSYQLANPDGTYQYNGVFMDRLNPNFRTNSSLFLALSTIAMIDAKNYEEYSEIDFQRYINELLSYVREDDDLDKSFLSCQRSYELVSNLESCKNTTCENIKKSAYESCKRDLEREMKLYEDDYKVYIQYGTSGIDKAYLLYMPSEMIYFNRLVELLDLKTSTYSKNDIVSYYNKAEKLQQNDTELIEQCFVLKNSEDMNLFFKDSLYLQKSSVLVSNLPEFNSLCEGNLRDRYCSLSISERLICADALSRNYPNIANLIIQDIFFKNYFESPGAVKMPSYENLRKLGLSQTGGKEGVLLEEYGYFVFREEEVVEDMGVVVGSYANMTDSYYFINLLDKLSYGK